VHHACNPKYIDRNYAGTLIVWDRLFGTFKQEEDEPVYGITKPLRSWNPVWANLHVWVDLADKARRTSRLADRVRLYLRPPGWRPDDLGGYEAPPEVDRATYRKFTTPLPRGLAAYVLVQFVLTLAGTSALLFLQKGAPRPLLAAGAAFAMVSLVAIGGLLERKPWSPALEQVRLAALPLVGWLATGSLAATGLAALAALACALWLSQAGPARDRATAA
jgi:alkylglycerol monooxygenase